MINKFIAAAALAAVSFGASAAGANIVNDGSFEATTIQSPPNWTTIFPTTIGPNWSADYGIEIRDGVAGSAEDGVNFAELDTYTNSTISQTLATTAGTTYTLSFWVEDRAGVDASSQGIDFSVGGISGSVTGGSTPSWTEFTRTFVASGASTVLTFAAAGTSDSLGSSLDNISVTAVPEPATMALMASGLALVGLSRRRARK